MSFALSKCTATFRTGIKNDGVGQNRNSLKHGFSRQLGATRQWVDQAYKRGLGKGSMRMNRLMIEAVACSSLQTAGQHISDRGSAQCRAQCRGHPGHQSGLLRM